MTKLRKFLFILFIFSVLAGHGIAEAQSQSPSQRLQSSCRAFASSCQGLRGKIPVFPKTAKAKNCDSNFRNQEGITYHVFIKNVPQQQAAREAAETQDQQKVCDTVKKAHKTCQIVAKRGKTVLKDNIKIFNSRGEQKCKQERKQVDRVGRHTTKPTNIVVRKDEKSGEQERSGKLRQKTVLDKRQTGTVSKVTGKSIAR